MEPGGLLKTINQYGTTDNNLLVSFENSDDASVYRLDDNNYLVSTVDVITPIVSDPFTFGQIAAANSLSDVFAMGADVLYALNVCSFPKEMDLKDADQIIAGALTKLNEIGAVLAGGHTISEPSLLFGLSVTGIIKDQKYFENNMAKENQSVYLTKPYGVGINYAANNNNLLSKEEYDNWIKVMTTLNYQASKIAKPYISTMSDVTGFGLLGHAYEIAKASNISIEIDFSKINFINNTLDFVDKGMITGASYTNLEYLKTKIHSDYDESINLLLCDPQTSGGLILFVDKEKEKDLETDFKEKGLELTKIGKTKPLQEYSIYVK